MTTYKGGAVLLIFILVLSAGTASAIQITASNTIRASNDTERSTSITNAWQANISSISGSQLVNGTGTYKLNITANYAGTCGGVGDYVRIVKNGAVVYTSPLLTGAYVNYSVTVSDMSTDDWLSVEGLAYEDPGFCVDTVNIKWFRVTYDYGYNFSGGNIYQTWGYLQDNNFSSVVSNSTNITLTTEIKVESDPSDYIERWLMDEGLYNISGSTANGVNTTKKHTGNLVSVVPNLYGMIFDRTKSSYINITTNFSDFNNLSSWSYISKVQCSPCTTNSQLALLSSWDGVNNSRNGLLFRWVTSTTPHKMQIYMNNDTQQNNAADFVAPVNISDGNSHIVQIDYNSSKIILEIDGYQSSTVASHAGKINPYAITNFSIGNSAHGLSTQGWNGSINDVMFFGRNLSVAERRLLQNYTHKASANIEFNNYNISDGFIGGIYLNGTKTSSDQIHVFLNASTDNVNWLGELELSYNATFDTILGVPEDYRKHYYKLRIEINSTNLSLDSIINKIIIYSAASIYTFNSPTKVNSAEGWNQLNTTINISSSIPIYNLTLVWRSGHNYLQRISNYSMVNHNSTNWNYSFPYLIDDVYYYYVSGDDGNGTLYNSTLIYTEIDNSLPSVYSLDTIYLLQFSNTSYYSSKSWVETNATLIEPEYRIFRDADSRFVPLYRCSGTNYFYDDISCDGNSSSLLGYILPPNNSNMYTVTLDRYNKSNSEWLTVANRTAVPTGYVFNKTLGFVEQSIGHVEDIIYINNSKIKVGLDKKYGGSIIYVSSNLSGNFNDTLNGINGNLIENYDCGRQIQMSYGTDSNQWVWYFNSNGSGTTNYFADLHFFDWTAGNANLYCTPPLQNSFLQNGNKVIINTETLNFIPDYGNGLLSELDQIQTLELDGEEPVILLNYTYINHGSNKSQSDPMVTPDNYTTNTLVHGHTNPSVYVGSYNIGKFYNTTSSSIETITNTSGSWGVGIGSVYDALFFAVVNSSSSNDYGLGVWNWARPPIQWHNATFNSSASTTVTNDVYSSTFNYSYYFFSPDAFFGIMNDSKSSFARIYVGNTSSMAAYFGGLEYGITWDNSTPINQTIANQNYLRVGINSTDIATINNATLRWTNGTGIYIFPMSIGSGNLSASINITSLTYYNYSYQVLTNSTTNIRVSTNLVWTNFIDTIFPASITNNTTTVGQFCINNTWMNPTDLDFSHIEMRNLTGELLGNLSNQTWNRTLSALYMQNISAQTVDSFGNVNQTRVWFNATVPNAPPNITLWGNNKYNNNSLNLTVNITESVRFNATANQIVTWVWYKDDYNHSNNYDNLTHQFLASNRTINITAYGFNTNGTTQNITWSVYVFDNKSYIPPVIFPSFAPEGDTYTGFSEFTSNENHLNWSENVTEVFNETAGSGLHFINYNFNSSSVTNASGTLNVTTNLKYMAGVGHTINVTVYNFTSLLYDLTCGTVNEYTNFHYNNCTSVSNTHYRNSTGATIVRLNHTANGNPSHRLFIDEMKITLGVTTINGYVPPTPTMISAVTGSNYINQTWTNGTGNITNSYNVSVNGIWMNLTIQPFVNNSYSSGQWQNITVYSINQSAYGLNQSLIALSNNTQMPAAGVGGKPNITAYFNNITGWNQTALSINVNNPTFMNVTVNQSISTVAFKIDGVESQNTSSLIWNYTWQSVGVFNVTMQANNSNGSSQVVYTVVTVTEGGSPPPCCGGGGTDWDYAYGYAKYPNGTGIPSVTITTPNGTTSTDALGYYSFGYIFVHSINVSFNFTKVGFDYNQTYGNFSIGDFQIVNATLNISSAPVIPSSPNITSWGNNFTSNASISFQVNAPTTVEFNITANQTLTGCTWTGIDIQINCTANSYAYKNFTSTGIKTVTAQGTNANGSTQIITWTINVNGTTTNSTVSGYINNTLGALINNAKINFGTNYTYSDINGSYSITLPNNLYSILVQQIGYNNLTSSIYLTGNVTNLNFTLIEKSSSPTEDYTPAFVMLALIIVFVLIFSSRKKHEEAFFAIGKEIDEINKKGRRK